MCALFVPEEVLLREAVQTLPTDVQTLWKHYRWGALCSSQESRPSWQWRTLIAPARQCLQWIRLLHLLHTGHGTAGFLLGASTSIHAGWVIPIEPQIWDCTLQISSNHGSKFHNIAVLQPHTAALLSQVSHHQRHPCRSAESVEAGQILWSFLVEPFEAPGSRILRASWSRPVEGLARKMHMVK